MKLKNRKTGEIPAKIETITLIQWSGKIMMVYIREDGERILGYYDTLADFNEDWEDYEEEKSWIDEVKVQELPSGLKIADRDYYEFDEDGMKKTEFTWDEAMEIEKKTNGKWRLPTPKELNQMAIDLGYNDNGVFEGRLFAKNLGIEDRFEGDVRSDYWSLRSASTTYSYGLNFNDTDLNPQNYNNRGYGFAVRCVAE